MLQRLTAIVRGKKEEAKEIICADKYVRINGNEVSFADGTKEGDELDKRGHYVIGDDLGPVKEKQNIFCLYYDKKNKPQKLLVGNSALVLLNHIVHSETVCSQEHLAYLLRKTLNEELQLPKKRKEYSTSRTVQYGNIPQVETLDLTGKTEKDLDWRHVPAKKETDYFRIKREKEGRKAKGRNPILCRQYNCESMLKCTIVGEDPLKIVYVIAHKELAPNLRYLVYLMRELLRAHNAGDDYAQELREESLIEKSLHHYQA